MSAESSSKQKSPIKSQSPKSPKTSKTPSSSSQAQDKDPNTNLRLPMQRIKMIMKSGTDIGELGVGPEPLFLITKATELYIEHVAFKSYRHMQQHNKSKSAEVEYKDLEILADEDNLDFLKEIIPKKMTAKAALHEIAKQNSARVREIVN